MTITRTNRSALRFAITGVLGSVILAGCSGGKHTAHLEGSASQAEQALAHGQTEKAVSMAEAAVSNAPRDAAARATLGRAYLKAGRFESASTALNDAMSLGDNSPRTALSLALSRIAGGHGHEAVALLDDWKDSIPAADRGLALALAGETSRGTAVLSDALRAGDNTPKVRQNLAYAYALDGRWNEAKTMMAQDVGADQVDQRISDWALAATPENYRGRVAALLKTPTRSDSGMPQALALNNSPSAEQLAAEASATPTHQVAQAELPPMAGSPAVAVADVAPPLAAREAPVAEAPVAEAPQATPVAQVAQAPQAILPEQPAAQSLAVAMPHQMAIKPVRAQASKVAYRSAAKPPVHAQKTFTQAYAHALPAAFTKLASAPRAVVSTKAAFGVGAHGTHAVQLGAFSSKQGARRAWGLFAARNPQLKHYQMAISQARVHGKEVWRVAAAGFDSRSANSMCSSVKSKGGVCFAYASRGMSPVKQGHVEAKLAMHSPKKSGAAKAPALALARRR